MIRQYIVVMILFVFPATLFSGSMQKKAFAIFTKFPPKIDGKVDKSWFVAPANMGFVQRTPEQGSGATNDTRFFVMYDRDNLYLLFIMKDRNPKTIPARLVDRDHRFYPDDSINFYLDTYNDNRKGFYFSTNPFGVEQDGLISENGDNVDMSWDTIYKVEARKNKYGWVAEFSIPLKNIRFEAGKRYQVWGFNVWRIRKASRETSYWSLVDQNYQMFRMDKGGVLVGLKNVRNSHNLNLLPYATYRTENQNSVYDSQGNFGLDLKYGISSDITLDLTINPDFGQVEIDEEQIRLDKRFEVQLDEKRPFYLENANLFKSPFYQLFYSRRIGAQSDIKSGVKVTGKAGSYSFGYLSALTGDWDNSGLGDPDKAPDDELFNVIRVQKDVHKSSNIGVLLADRESNLGGSQAGYNRALSTDWSFYQGQNYFLGQAVYSLNSNFSSISGTAEKVDGFGLFAQAGHYGKLFWVDAHAHYYDDQFDIDSTGFFQRLPGKGKKQAGLYTELHPIINRKYLRSYGFSVQPTIVKDSDEQTTGFGFQNAAWIEFPDQTKFKVGFTRYRDAESDLFYYYFNRQIPEEFSYWGRDLYAEIRTDEGKMFALYAKLNWDSQYYYHLHQNGFTKGLEANLKVNPVSNFHLELGYKNRRFLNRDNDFIQPDMFGQTDIQIWTARIRYLFTKNIFSRGFVQYSNAADIYDTQQAKFVSFNRLSVNTLLGMRYLPGSTMYFVYTQEWDDYSTGNLNSRNQIFFLKFSYFWSL